MKKHARGNGFNLVVLVMAITVLNILLAMALPSWSTFIQRQREEELIFRGLQYAEAIRVFQIRNNRYPTQLRELVEVQPRSIRQLWRNPLAEDGSWLLLPAQTGRRLNQEQQNQNQQGQQQQGQQNQQGERPGNGQQEQGRNANRPVQRPGAGPAPTAVRVVPPKPGELQFTPQPSVLFVGVASPEGETALKSFMGSQEISEWHFTAEMVSAMHHDPNHNFSRPVSSSSFWKPFPPGITPPTAASRTPGNPMLRPQQRRRRPQ